MAPFGTAASAVVNCNHFHSLLCVHVLTVLFLSRSRCCRQTGSIAAHLRCTVFPQEGRLPPFLARSPQLCLRRCLTDWIATLGQQLHLGSITRHLAVLMLDLFMERHDVPPTQLLATALSCLVIACKFEECEEHIPRRKTLAEVLNVCLPGVSVEHLLGRDVMLQTEMQVLAGLSWALFLPTAAHFSDYFLTLALHEVSFPSHQGRDKQLHLRRSPSSQLPAIIGCSSLCFCCEDVRAPTTHMAGAYKSDRDANKKRKEQLLEPSQPEVFTLSRGKCTNE
uniref:cyclin-J-like isoform X4 n=1 Tax=Myxine glutinosa TaxID=7769 RepID=UPI00358F19DF